MVLSRVYARGVTRGILARWYSFRHSCVLGVFLLSRCCVRGAAKPRPSRLNLGVAWTPFSVSFFPSNEGKRKRSSRKKGVSPFVIIYKRSFSVSYSPTAKVRSLKRERSLLSRLIRQRRMQFGRRIFFFMQFEPSFNFLSFIISHNSHIIIVF